MAKAVDGKERVKALHGRFMEGEAIKFGRAKMWLGIPKKFSMSELDYQILKLFGRSVKTGKGVRQTFIAKTLHGAGFPMSEIRDAVREMVETCVLMQHVDKKKMGGKWKEITVYSLTLYGKKYIKRETERLGFENPIAVDAIADDGNG